VDFTDRLFVANKMSNLNLNGRESYIMRENQLTGDSCNVYVCQRSGEGEQD